MVHNPFPPLESGQDLVEGPFPDTLYDGEWPDWTEIEELHGEFMNAVQAEPGPVLNPDPLPLDAIDVFPQEIQTVATAVNDQLLHELGNAIHARREELAYWFVQLQQCYPVWWQIWRLVLQRPDEIDVADSANHATPPLARIHLVAFRSYYKYNIFLVSSYLPHNADNAERWIAHALVHEKVKHMTKIVVEVGIERQDSQDPLDPQPIIVDSVCLYRLVTIAMAIWPDHKNLNVCCHHLLSWFCAPTDTKKILEVRLKFYNEARTFHTQLQAPVADLMIPIVQDLLTQVKDYMEGTLPASTWLPAATINSWQRSRIDEMVRINLAFHHARLMEVYLDPIRAADVVNNLQQEYKRLS